MDFPIFSTHRHSSTIIRCCRKFWLPPPKFTSRQSVQPELHEPPTASSLKLRAFKLWTLSLSLRLKSFSLLLSTLYGEPGPIIKTNGRTGTVHQSRFIGSVERPTNQLGEDVEFESKDQRREDEACSVSGPRNPTFKIFNRILQMLLN